MFLVPLPRQANEFSRSMERLFDDTLAGLSGHGRSNQEALRSPALDVSENDNAYVVKLEMPGVPKEAVKITIDGRRVHVEAEQVRDDEKKQGERVLYRERAVQRYARSFSLPLEISQSDSSATMEHGVLTLNLAKRQAKGGTQLPVQ